MPGLNRRAVLLTTSVALLLLGAFGPIPGAAAARPAKGVDGFIATLSATERKAFEDYLAAKTLHDFTLDTYWRQVTDKRALRRGKKSRGEPLTAKDYVRTFPPAYGGPELSADLAKRWAAYQAAADQEVGKPPPTPKPGLADFLAYSKSQYDFVPEIIPEREFKLRYAREAMALGLTKDQVVRVYALETSGLGTADMVAGIHPIKKTGSPISTALGYAQLLAANSTDELVNHGAGFLERLGRMASDPSLSEDRRAALVDKHAKVQAMLAAARSVPHRWDDHVAFARTPKGLGIHALNLDGDIGPWLQVVKLQGLKKMAEKDGIAALKGAEIELMNLAGPGTGLEMMRPAGLEAPTPNFFERGAYSRNTIVREKTSKELLSALDSRMDKNIVNAGAIEFSEVFSQVARERQAAR
ncbi:MAG: hypothetical protein WC807_00030 [Hyphomicrobium sp.]